MRISGLWKRIHLPNSIDVGGNEEAGGGEEDVGKLAASSVGRDDGLMRDMGQGGKLGLRRAGGRHAVGAGSSACEGLHEVEGDTGDAA